MKSSGKTQVKGVSFQAKKAYFEKFRQMNYQASLRLEGMRPYQADSLALSNARSSKKTVLNKQESSKQP
jgi:hypothetical protein